jgi:hypothetical protein
VIALSCLLLQILKSIFTCAHTQCHASEGKTYCPDCGTGIVFRWTTLCCNGCGRKRPARYRFRQVVPLEACCIHCGEAAYERQFLSNPEYFQLRYALLSFEEDTRTYSPLYQVSATLSSFIQDTLRSVKPSTGELPLLTVHLAS